MGPGTLRFFPFGSGRGYAQAYAPLTTRNYDLVMNMPWVNRFKFTFTLPAGYVVADPPADLTDATPFGTAWMSIKNVDGKLVCEGQLTFAVARVKAADYPKFREWLGRVDQAFSRRVLAANAGGQTAQAH